MNVRGAGHLYRRTYQTAAGEKRKAGVYWWKCGRIRVSTGMRTEEEAQQWAVERLVEMRRGHLVGIRGPRPTWTGPPCRKHGVAVGVPAALIHDLRRTAARDLRRAGVPLAEAMGQLGHRDVRTHQDYSTVARADQTEALARLEALRAGEPVQQRLAMIRR
jgi:hypothetical protein